MQYVLRSSTYADVLRYTDTYPVSSIALLNIVTVLQLIRLRRGKKAASVKTMDARKRLYTAFKGIDGD
jgi:hypothetical protein